MQEASTFISRHHHRSSSEPDGHAPELLLMRQVVQLVGRGTSAAPILREMLHLMSELMGLNRGRVVLLRDPDEAEDDAQISAKPAAIAYAYGLTRNEVERGRYAPGEGITGHVLAFGESAIVQDIDADPYFLFRSVHRSHLPTETVSFLAAPIEIDGEVKGVLACHRLRQRARRLGDDIELLRVLATLAGQVLQLERLVKDEHARLHARNEVLERALESASARYGLIGNSPALLTALSELERVAPTQVTVLLLGESGTGKELFARALHLSSPRRDAPFIKVNCSAIPETLFESELFGHEKGAFTGAHAARAGLFEQAHGGTIFLDEIGELPLAMQAKLLRTLQEGTLVRLGGHRETRVNVRLVAATHRDLSSEVAAGRFRQDLFYRLHVVPIRLPSLRERRTDIHALVLHFVSRANQQHERHVSIEAGAMALLEQHDWPGNIRELGNLIERVVLLVQCPRVSRGELAKFMPTRGAEPDACSLTMVARASTALAQREPVGPTDSGVRAYVSARSHSTEALRSALELHHGNQTRAAQSLGLSLRQFNYRLLKAGLR